MNDVKFLFCKICQVLSFFIMILSSFIKTKCRKKGLNDRLIREDTCGPGYLCVLEATPWQIPSQLQEVVTACIPKKGEKPFTFPPFREV